MIRSNIIRFLSLCLGAVLLLPQAGFAQQDGDKEILYWVAPMDPNYRRDQPGKSPMGMNLVPVYAGADDEPGNIVSIAPGIVQNLGVRTATAERSRLWRGISTVGYVDFDESKTSHIHLRTEGWIERLYVESEGERVSKGQRLFDLYSPALVNAQEEFIQALKIGNKGLEQASHDRLTALGIPADQIRQLKKDRRARQTIALYAPQDGVVSTLMVREGMFVKPANRVMSLAELSTVWLLTEVFERQADWVKVGQPAEVRLPYLPGRTWEGRVEYIYPSLDPKTRTLKARLRFDNPDEALKPNMYAHVKIFGGPKEDTIVIPLEALIRTGREERIILSLGEGRFESRTVTAGIESGDWVEILTGIDPGDSVVISGQFLIDSEASLKASMRRMGSPDSDPEVEQP
jgi:Cu(I)/Ag(I) efflux system membrane fusion protein